IGQGFGSFHVAHETEWIPPPVGFFPNNALHIVDPDNSFTGSWTPREVNNVSFVGGSNDRTICFNDLWNTYTRGLASTRSHNPYLYPFPTGKQSFAVIDEFGQWHPTASVIGS